MKTGLLLLLSPDAMGRGDGAPPAPLQDGGGEYFSSARAGWWLCLLGLWGWPRQLHHQDTKDTKVHKAVWRRRQSGDGMALRAELAQFAFVRSWCAWCLGGETHVSAAPARAD
jgi:hypothetical protein